MSFRTQFACLLGGLAALLVGVSAHQITNAKGGAGSWWHGLPDSPDAYSEAERLHERLCRFDGVLTARIHERKEIVDQLRDGKVDLFAAAAHFKRMNHLPNVAQFDPLVAFRGASEDEKVCRQVINWLVAELQSQPPSQRQAVLDRLEAELADHLARHGKVVLPED
jgi:hypothetical protein